ncbi:MAG: amidase [SAR202 cluster bacterium]|nr:amidase [SAR202 cluster bacterium]|tara:strand:+ start:36460 stop:37809 length:1350 start_codon:yes stop_codon:yes gene_type:complete
MSPHEFSAAQAASHIRKGKLSCADLAKDLIKRSEQLNPELNLWAELDPERVIEDAIKKDQQLQTHNPDGPLHGIPLGIKDIFNTKGIKTSHGSPIYKSSVPKFDATSVSLLKAAGAIIMGKTITTEFACGDPPPTLNPWNKSRTPGGSSTGSAVGVASNIFPVAMGSQTAGSVLRPAAYNGVVGTKPTMGRISRYGVHPVSWSVDTMGFFSRNVEDAALMLSILAKPDSKDQYSSYISSKDLDFDQHCASKPKSIGILQSFFLEDCDTEIKSHVSNLTNLISNEGVNLKELNLPFDMDLIHAAHRMVMNVNGASVHEQGFDKNPQNYGPDVRRMIEIGKLTPSTTYIKGEKVRQVYRRALLKLIEPYDVVITSTTKEAGAPGTSTTGDPRWQAAITTAGLPAISLPYSVTADGLPLGIQIIGKPFSDKKLLSIAAWIEELVGFKLKPSV